MTLKLEIVGPNAAQFGDAARWVFAGRGGTIGRAADNDWVIPDAYISGHHARVYCRDGLYYLEDTSTNGVFISSPANRLAKGQVHTLRSGDRFFIDTYEIRATLGADASVDLTEKLPAQAGDSAATSQASNTDWMNLFGIGQSSKTTRDASVGENAGQALQDQEGAFERTIPLSKPESISEPKSEGITFDEWFPTDASSVAEQPQQGKRVDSKPADNRPDLRLVPSANAPSKSPSQASPVSTSATATHWVLPDPADVSNMRSVLIGAGFSEDQLTPELAEEFGRILRIVVSGVMDVLHEGSHIKEEFRLRATTIKSSNNNPLKFSANVEDALHNLFVKRNAAFLEPVDAFEDAFEDVRNRQVAVMVAMRVAFDSMLSRFEPDRLEAQFGNQAKRGGMFAFAKKARCWDSYRDMYSSTVKDSEKSFRELFGEEFAKAYEGQLQRMRSPQRQPTK